MGYYKKKPIVIQAVLCRDAIQAFKVNWSVLPDSTYWLFEAYQKGNLVITDAGIYIKTLEGDMLANPDDYIICGVKGEIYPCKPDIFEATYETWEA